MMEKILVETTGSFMLQDSNGQEVQANRPCVVRRSQFIHSRTALGQLKVLGQLKDEATDAEFLQYFRDSEGDAPLAVESFLSKFSVDAVSEKPKTRRGRRKQEEQPTDEE